MEVEAQAQDPPIKSEDEKKREKKRKKKEKKHKKAKKKRDEQPDEEQAQEEAQENQDEEDVDDEESMSKETAQIISDMKQAIENDQINVANSQPALAKLKYQKILA